MDNEKYDIVDHQERVMQACELESYIFSHAWDILNESDEILQPRFQLIYTIGLPQHMDGFPEHWTITQQVLRLFSRHASSIAA